MLHLLLREPYLWLQYCFFQPVVFQREYEAVALSQRLKMALRLTPLLFLYSYSPALVLRIILYHLRPEWYPSYGTPLLLPLSADMGWFVFDATWAAALSCLVATFIGGIFSLRFAIAVGLALSVANGIIVHTINDPLVCIVFGIAFGLVLGIAFNSAHAITLGAIGHVTRAIGLGIALGLMVGGFTGILGGYWAGFAIGTVFPALQTETNIWGSTAGLFVGGVGGCFLAALLGSSLKRAHKSQGATVAVGIGIAVASAFGLAVGIPVGDAGVSATPFLESSTAGIAQEALVALPFLLCYLLSYYRLPLYPISAYSLLQVYLAAQSKGQQALSCLQHSSLHWDECVFLPLPYLRKTLLLAAEQARAETLEELRFIFQQRPQQRWAAQAAVYELALCDLEQRTLLHSIGQAHQHLALYLPPEVRALSPDAEVIFRHLDDASREAASYHTQTRKKDRQDALERMMHALQQIPQPVAFRRAELDQHLNVVVSQWKLLAAQGKATLGSIWEGGWIDNPYAPGKVLEVRDPLFVGRDDVVQKVGQALQRPTRPTFLLTGERRMGKSSILRQLPVLLGARCIAVFYDLQSPGMLASTAAFFSSVIAEIERVFRSKGLPACKLERTQLEEAQRQQEVLIYDLLEQWVRQVEQVLEQDDLILLLAFDEFEKLEEAQERNSIHLGLLFDFFRSVIQNRSRLVLLFSGARLVGDMGRRWAGYFVNVERIKVSFLREADARALIMNPVPHIFPEEVVQHIMQVTHGHPFLIQAVCKHLIEGLNESSREQANEDDIATAIGEVFEAWPGYFWDLWDRSDHDQQTCLLALLALGQADMDRIAQWSGLGKTQTRQAVERLRIRDLVRASPLGWHIAIPMFAQWVQQTQRADA